MPAWSGRLATTSFTGPVYCRVRRTAGSAPGLGKVWKLRGGGLYALGYAITFVYLEVTTIIGDIAGAESPWQFFTSELIEFVFRFLSDSLVNLVKALIWPVYVIELAPPWGLLGLGAAFLIFPRFLKPTVERWLFGDQRRAALPRVEE